MNFTEIAKQRQSCRSYDPTREVEGEKLDAILAAARLAPSACNGQPYHITLCKGAAAKAVAATEQGKRRKPFVQDAPVKLVISDSPYHVEGDIAPILEKFRGIDIGILAAYITAEATAQGLGSCIMGWQDDEELRALCHLDGAIRLVILVGYATEGDPLRDKKRLELTELADVME